MNMHIMPAAVPLSASGAAQAISRFLTDESPEKEKPWQADPRRGFDIGWEYAQLGEYPPKAERPAEEAPMREVRSGFEAGMAHFRTRGWGSGEDHLYVRKYLQLKLHAWTRGRLFNDDITPAYLKQIRSRVCPITRKVMTAATGQPTDWSIDRLMNDGCYARGNLVTVSSGVNHAKGRLSYAEVLAIVATNRTYKGLTAVEWERMAALMGIVSDKDSILPLLVIPPTGLTMINRYAALQTIALMAPFYSDAKGGLCKRLLAQMNAVIPGKKGKKAMTQFFAYAWGVIQRRHQQSTKTRDADDAPGAGPMEFMGDMWRDQLLIERFRQWMDAMPAGGELACVDAIRRVAPGLLGRNTNPQDWGLATRGYTS